MRKYVRILLECVALSLLTIAVAGCYSSKKTVKGSSGVVVRKVDYGEMRSDLKSREYEVPVIGELIREASTWVGVPYRYAGNDKKGVDCSGLTSQVYLKVLDVKIPRSSREQQQWCDNVNKDNLLPGDLVFFATGSDPNRVSHVGLYVGNGDIIHASWSSGVIVSNLNEKYYLKRYHSAGRPKIVKQLYASAGKSVKKKKKQKNDAEDSPIDGKRNVVPESAPAIIASPSNSASSSSTAYPSGASGASSTSVPNGLNSGVSSTTVLNGSSMTANPEMTVTVDQLMEIKTDSVANTVPRSTVPPIPAINITEPSDTILIQYFD